MRVIALVSPGKQDPVLETGSDHPPCGYAFLALCSLRPRPRSDQGARRKDHGTTSQRQLGRAGSGWGAGVLHPQMGRPHGDQRPPGLVAWAVGDPTAVQGLAVSLGQQTAVQDPASGIIEVPGSEDAALLAVDFHAGRRWCLRGRGRCEESPEDRVLWQDAPGPRMSPQHQS